MREFILNELAKKCEQINTYFQLNRFMILKYHIRRDKYGWLFFS